MKKWRIGLLIAMVTLAIFVLTGCGTQTINLNKYVTITCEGYDTIGKATVTFDSEQFKKDYGNKIKYNKDSKEAQWAGALMTGLLNKEPADLLLDTCVAGSLDRDSNLSNGDKITFRWVNDESTAEEYFNCKLSYSDISYDIKNLKKVDNFDPFQHLTVTFNGVSGRQVDVLLEKDQSAGVMQLVKFETDWANKSVPLQNGDTILVRVDASDLNAMAEQYNKIPNSMEKSYTVEGLPYYVYEQNQMPQELIDEMFEDVEEFAAKDLDGTIEYAAKEKGELVSTERVGYYLLTTRGNNIYYPIVKVTAKDIIYHENDITDYYLTLPFESILKNVDGSCSLEDEYRYCPNKISEPNSFGDYYYIPQGYLTLKDLYGALINPAAGEGYKYTTDIQLDGGNG